jgi:hypothetical protein
MRNPLIDRRWSARWRNLSFFIISIAALAALGGMPLKAQTMAVVDRATGLRLQVADDMACPTLRLTLPGSLSNSGSVLIVYPEHVTVVQGNSEPKHLYLWWPPQHCTRPNWRRDGQSLEYEMDMKDNVQMLARITLDADGVRYYVKITNRSAVNYDNVQAIWDPRFYHSIFRDSRLERTYVHRKAGWELLASDTPDRLTMPLSKWFPLRYMDDYTWPVPPPDKRAVKRSDGITYYDASQPVNIPVIATLSLDKRWVAATYTKECGNVWTNPEITCQHANPEAALKAGGTAILEGKTFVFKGSLNQLLEKVKLESERETK